MFSFHKIYAHCIIWVLSRENLIALNPACSTTETRKIMESFHVSSLDILSESEYKSADQTARMRRLVCAFVVRKHATKSVRF